MLVRLSLIILFFGIVASPAGAQPSLCRLGFVDVCEPVSAQTQLSERQKEIFREWIARYTPLRLDGEALVLAFSDLPQAIRHALFLEDGRPLARPQVWQRILALSPRGKGHPVLEGVLSAMPTAFGDEARFYTGLEKAIHQLLVSNPGGVAQLRREMLRQLTSSVTAAAKTPPAPPAWAPTPRETARVD